MAWRGTIRAAVAAVVLGLPAGAQEDEGDRGLLARTIQNLLSSDRQTVVIRGLEGALSSTATIGAIIISDPDGEFLRVEDVELDWNRLALVRRRLDVNSLSIGRVAFLRPPVPDPAKPPSPEAQGFDFSIPDLPVAIDVAEVALERLELGEEVLGEAVEARFGGIVQLAEGAGLAELTLERTDDQPLSAAIRSSFDNTSTILSVDIGLDEAAGGLIGRKLGIVGAPSLSLFVKGRGPLSDFAADINLSTDGTPRIAGQVALTDIPAVNGAGGRGFEVDLSGDVTPLFLPAYQAFFGPDVALSLKGQSLDDGRLVLRDIGLASAALNLGGNLTLGADRWPLSADLNGVVAAEDGSPVLLPTTGNPVRVGRVDLQILLDQRRRDGWVGTFQIDELTTSQVGVTRAGLSASGILRTPADGLAGEVTAKVDADVEGLSLADPALAAAMGEDVQAKLDLTFQTGAPLRLPALVITGKEYGAEGSAEIDWQGETVDVTADLDVRADDLSRFSLLAGMPLSGAADAGLTGAADLGAATFRADLRAGTDDLGIGQPQADLLLAGQGALRFEVVRDETGLSLNGLDLTTNELRATADAKVATGDTRFDFTAGLRDVGVLAPDFSGPLEAVGEGAIGTEGVSTDLRLSGPGLDGVSLRASAPRNFERLDGAVQGAIDLALANGIAAPLALAGVADLDLALVGPVEGASIEGSVVVRDGAVLQPEPALSLTAFEAATNVDGTLSNIVKSPDGPGAPIGFAGALETRLSGLEFSDPAATEAVGGAAEAAMRAEFTAGQRLSVSDLVADFVGVAVAGNLNLELAGTAPVLDADLSVVAPDLARFAPLAGQDIAGAATIEAVASGALGDGALEAELAAETDDLAIGVAQADAVIGGRGRLAARLRREGPRLSVDEFTLRTAEIEATAGGFIAPDAAAFQFAAGLRDLGVLSPGFTGPFDSAGRLLFGTAGLDVDLQAQGPGIPGITVIANAPSDFSTLTAAVAGDIDLAVANAFVAPTEMGGAVDIDITFDGPVESTSVDGRIEVSDATVLTGEGTELGFSSSTSLSGVAEGLVAAPDGAPPVPAIRARLDSSLSDVVSNAPALTAALGADLAAGFDVDFATNERLVLSDLRIGGTDFELTGAADLALGDREQPVSVTALLTAEDLSRFAALAGTALSGAIDAQFEATGDLADQSGDLRLSADTTGLGVGQTQVDRLIGGAGALRVEADRIGEIARLTLFTIETGEVNAKASGEVLGEDAQAEFEIAVRNLGLVAPGFNGPLEATGRARRASGQNAFELAMAGPGLRALELSGTAPTDFSTADATLTGIVDLALANGVLSPNQVRGDATLDLSLNGPPEMSALGGSVSLRDAQLAIPALPFSLSGIGADVELAGGRARIDAAAGLSTGGGITVAGPIVLRAPYRGSLAVALNNPRLTDGALYETTLSGQLTVNGPLTGGATIAGDLQLLDTEFRISEIPASFSGPLENIRHIGEPAGSEVTRTRAGVVPDDSGPPPNPPPPFALDIGISTGDPLFIRGRGLDVELGGALQVGGTTAETIPIGQLDMERGRFDILGRRLDFDEGAVSMQGTFIPWVDFQATSETSTADIFVRVSGPALDPEIEFTSSPSLPDDEVLARFLFDRDISELSAFQAAQLANSLLILSGRGGTDLGGTARAALGIDDLDIDTNDNDALSLRAGKYISDNIYTGLGVDAEGGTQLNLNLRITDSLTARGAVESTGTNSIGIFFERDY
ncbi:MAG: translocation/assembly module TamB domain-containing protein [Pseudomonadota bacterium]